MCYTHWSDLSWNFFSNYLQMDTHFFFAQETSSQVLGKWVPIYFFGSRIIFLKLFTNWYPCFLSQGFYEITSCRSNSWTNQICSKFHKINPSLKLHQEFFFLNKSIANQPNWFKSTKFESSSLKSTMHWKLHGSTWVILCDGVVLDYIFVFCSFCF